MAATSNIVATSGIVLEPLAKDNYDNWSTLVRNYLMGQDLWDVVVPETDIDPETPAQSKMKKAKALHIIQLACGSQNLTHIRKVETAYEAWNKLSVMYRSYLETDPNISQDVALDILRAQGTLKVPLAFDLASGSKDLQPLYALACVPSAFVSGSKNGLLRQFIYKILIILRSDISQRIVKDDDDVNVNVAVTQDTQEEDRRITQEKDQRKSSFTGKFYGWMLNCEPIKLLGRKILPFYMSFQNSILLKLPGIMKIYNQKKKHLLVREILSCMHEIIQEFNETQLREALAYDAMLQAAKLGIIEFIDEMRKANPNLLWAIDQNKRGIFTHAVMNRRKDVFKLIDDEEVNGRQDIIKGRPDASGNTILHMAAYLGPSSDLDNRFGPALQMQREIQWFKKVESTVHSRCRKAKNPEGKKPDEVFKEEHRELVKAGEKWAKETAGHFALVGTLIITIMFAAAFTIPGANNQNDKILTAFIISDAVSLFTSSASVLLFIGILTSRYDENDFHWNLPLKLLFGLFFLFLSVISMIVAFCSSLAMYKKGHQTVKIVAVSLGSVPLVVLIPSLRLFYEILKSTIRS